MSEDTIVSLRNASPAARTTENRLAQALRAFGDRLADTLEDTTSLEVITYVSSDMGTIQYDVETGKLTGAAQPCAITHISFDGDTLVCVPENQGTVNAAVWQIHTEMVKQAQNYRLHLVRTAFSLVQSLREL